MLQLPQGLAFRCPLSPPGPGRVGLHPGKGRPQEPLPLPAASVAWTWPECWDPLGLSGICSQSAPARRRLHQVTEHEEQGTGVPETVPGGARSPPLVSSSVSPASPPSPLLMTDDSTSRAWTRSTVGGGSGCCPAAGGWAARAGGNPHVSVASDPPPHLGRALLCRTLPHAQKCGFRQAGGVDPTLFHPRTQQPLSIVGRAQLGPWPVHEGPPAQTEQLPGSPCRCRAWSPRLPPSEALATSHCVFLRACDFLDVWWLR